MAFYYKKIKKDNQIIIEFGRTHKIRIALVLALLAFMALFDSPLIGLFVALFLFLGLIDINVWMVDMVRAKLKQKTKRGSTHITKLTM